MEMPYRDGDSGQGADSPEQKFLPFLKIFRRRRQKNNIFLIISLYFCEGEAEGPLRAHVSPQRRPAAECFRISDHLRLYNRYGLRPLYGATKT
jgi:hypothetical protein